MRCRDVVPVFLRLAPRDIAMAKFVFESYEGVGIVRTLDRREAVIVVLVVPDHVDTVDHIIESLQAQIACEVIPAPVDAGDDWLLGAVLRGRREAAR